MESSKQEFFVFQDKDVDFWEGRVFQIWVSKIVDFLVLFGLGVFVIVYVGTGKIINYLHPFFHFPVFLAGVCLVVLSFFRLGIHSLIYCGCGICFSEGLAARAWSFVARFFLVVVVGVAAFFSRGEFGEEALMNRGVAMSASEIGSWGNWNRWGRNFALTATQSEIAWPDNPALDPTTYLAKTPEGRIRAETLDLVLAAQDADLRPDFEDKQVEILGRILPMPESKQTDVANGDFLVVRVFMLCCAADARPIGVAVRGKLPENFSKSDWAIVRGTARFDKVGRTILPFVEAVEILPTEPPRQRTLFN